jgi:hypothetical protein
MPNLYLIFGSVYIETEVPVLPTIGNYKLICDGTIKLNIGEEVMSNKIWVTLAHHRANPVGTVRMRLMFTRLIAEFTVHEKAINDIIVETLLVIFSGVRPGSESNFISFVSLPFFRSGPSEHES